jgi:hypothetical protein
VCKKLAHAAVEYPPNFPHLLHGLLSAQNRKPNTIALVHARKRVTNEFVDAEAIVLGYQVVVTSKIIL